MNAVVEPGSLHRVLLFVLVSCVPDGQATGASGGSHGTDTTTTSISPVSDSSVADSTGAHIDPACIDDYHGNQHRPAALELALDTSDTAVLVLGDGSAAIPPESGNDELVVCASHPSDFFVMQTQCPAHLAIEARALEGKTPELLLYDGALPLDAEPIAQVMGTWDDFFLKPLHRALDAGSYIIEVRHSGGVPQRYSLTVTVLPDSTCIP